ncbi:hypothetical protein [Oerskovia sp. Root918]|uniref:hypothetical protein n=1 Tax=Oerskovia sp. Root918 TaxID=1736607 RepID=UPI000AE3584B|nr:hypothetical protein [Oerskovia sp. Root918]
MIASPAKGRVDRAIGAILTVSLAVVLILALTAPAPPAAAADAGNFQPGNIISDSVFQDSAAMSQAEIQSFLNTRGANCVAGEKPCLKDYRETTRTRPIEAGYCWPYSGANNESAAAIITKVSQACGVSPRVLLVMLEKENSLVTRSRPTTRNYDAAMGFGCPDTAPCNTEYYGFSNQVYRAARQFLVYRANPTRYGYQAGRTNNILFHPNAACGTSPVYIQNQSTAALYIYTPYQPNNAALANLYGTGDSCSSYGNRNFWRLFTDWFGSTSSGTSLVRSASDATVYLVSENTKYPITDWQLYLTFLERLGPLGSASDEFLASRTTGDPLSRIVRDSGDGGIYLIADGQRFHFPSCAVVAAWGGGACTRYSTLSSAQVSSFPRGTTLSDLVLSSHGALFWLTAGVKREVMNGSLVSSTGAAGPQTTLPTSVLAHLPYGQPVLPADSMAVARETTAPRWMTQGGTRFAVPADAQSQTALRDIPAGMLDGQSINAMPVGAPFGGKAADSSGAEYLLTVTGLLPLSGVEGAVPGTATTFSAASLARFPLLPAATAPVFARSVERSEVYLLENGVRRWARTWDDLVAVAGTAAPRIVTVPQSTLDAIPLAGLAIPAGTLIKADGRPEIYLVDGSAKIHLESFVEAHEIGLSSWRTVDTATVNGYRGTTSPLSSVITCGPNRFVGQRGVLIPRRPLEADPDALPVTPLTTRTCERLKTSSEPARTGPVFVKGSGSTVYSVGSSGKIAVPTWDALLALNSPHGTPLIATINDAALSRIP